MSRLTLYQDKQKTVANLELKLYMQYGLSIVYNYSSYFLRTSQN